MVSGHDDGIGDFKERIEKASREPHLALGAKRRKIAGDDHEIGPKLACKLRQLLDLLRRVAIEPTPPKPEVPETDEPLIEERAHRHTIEPVFDMEVAEVEELHAEEPIREPARSGPRRRAHQPGALFKSKADVQALHRLSRGALYKVVDRGHRDDSSGAGIVRIGDLKPI